MAATALSQSSSTEQNKDGPRQVQIRTDLAAVADLIELAFAPTMDEAGRAAVRDLRMISSYGPLMLLVTGLNRVLGDVESGFVWTDNGRIVGNVSVGLADMPRSMGLGYVIANVAVHPDFRRRGIAKALMEHSLEMVRKRGADFVILQADASNEAARALYRGLGFTEQRIFARWYRSSHLRPPARLPEMPFMTLRQPNEWRSEYAIAQVMRPNERGGMGWQRATHPDAFRPSWRRAIGSLLVGRTERRWIVRMENGRDIAASLRVESQFGSLDRLELLVHPIYVGKLEEPLINFALRMADGGFHSVTMEHPLDDAATVQVLERYDFERRYTTVSMRLDL